MQKTLPLLIESQGAAQTGHGSAHIRILGRRERVRRALKPFLIGAAILLSVILIPIVHLVGAAIFIGCTAFAWKRFHAGEILESIDGRCPVCGTQGAFFAWDGRQVVEWPMRSYCLHCNTGAKLTPLDASS